MNMWRIPCDNQELKNYIHMKKAISFIIFIVLFTLVYYGCYFATFSFNYKDLPLIKAVQEKIILDKDVVGKTLEGIDINKKYDFLFLGSSHCYRCFDPAIFKEHGFEAYNLGSSSQTPLNSYVLLSNYIHCAKSVILEVYPVAFNLTGEESFLSMNASINDYLLLAQTAWHLNSLRDYNAITIKPFIDDYNKDKPLNITNSINGYVSTADSVKDNVTYEKIVLNTDYIKEQVKYLEKIIELCKKNDCKLYLVYAPVPKEHILVGENDFISKINSVAAENNLLFFDYGRNHTLDSRNNFFDHDHMNQSGVNLFNNWVIKDLTSAHQ